MSRRMKPGEFAEACAFAAVATARSFRGAALDLGLSPSTLSHSVRALENRLGQRLLHRTTRAVTVTEAGARLLRDLAPALALLEDAVAAAGTPEHLPAGTVRLAAPRLAIQMFVAPAILRLSHDYPHVTLDVRTVERPGDLAEGFDFGIQLGGDVAQDMVAVPLTGPFTTAVVGSPAYFAKASPPISPRDLVHHSCIGCRSGPGGSLYRWMFSKDGVAVTVDVTGTLITDDADLMLQAALDGIGLWHGVDLIAEPMIADGRLSRVLTDWSPTYPGFYLYYAAGAPMPAAARAVIDLLKRDAVAPLATVAPSP
jgi:DNA-binding transcriptional LysR family regulator